MSATTEHARYVKVKGFLCSKGNHVLYCPDLSKAEKSKPFYLYCARHDLMFEIDLSSNEAADFAVDFPHGCKET